jgi:hypothetical protein
MGGWVIVQEYDQSLSDWLVGPRPNDNAVHKNNGALEHSTPGYLSILMFQLCPIVDQHTVGFVLTRQFQRCFQLDMILKRCRFI